MKPSLHGSCRRGAALKPLALAVALALPSAPSWAASMKDVVSTRADRSIDEHYGRDSVYAIAGDKRLKPGHSVADLGRVFSKAKPYRAAALPSRPQAYGRAGGYIGWERIVVMQLSPTTVATSVFPDRHVVNLAARPEDDAVAVYQGVHPYRHESAAGSDEGVNQGSPVTNEGEGRSGGGTNTIPALIEQPASAVSALLEPVQPAGDLRATKDLSGGQEDPDTKEQPEPAPFTSKSDLSAIVPAESADDTMDNTSGDQSDPEVHALPEQATLSPEDQSYFDAEDHSVDPTSVESSDDTSVTDNPGLEQSDSATEIVVPLAAPSDQQVESAPVAATLDEGHARGTNPVQPPVEDLPEVEITVAVVGEGAPLESIRMLKRAK